MLPRSAAISRANPAAAQASLFMLAIGRPIGTRPRFLHVADSMAVYPLLAPGPCTDSCDEPTKLAKLDFFVRYPEFFRRAAEAIGAPSNSIVVAGDSSMVRYRYGPWDDRYYHLLSYLESTGLITIQRIGRLYRVALTEDGDNIAAKIGEDSSYATIVRHMQDVKKVMGAKGGTTLKKLIYRLFESEVVAKPMGEVIK